MFNTDSLDQARKDFAENRFCIIDNVLQDEYITEIYDAVKKIDYGRWGCIHTSHQKISPEKLANIDEAALRDEYKQSGQGTFGYWHMAKWILKEEDCVFIDHPLTTEFTRVCVEDYQLGKPDTSFMDLAEYVSGFTNMYTHQPTYSAYDHTSWLKAHHDPKRWLAYIFYLNDTWETHWGGQLCIMNDDEHTIKTSVEPFGNRLLLMDVSATIKDRINKHFISPVSYAADHPRYTLTGWFYPKDTDGPSPLGETK